MEWLSFLSVLAVLIPNKSEPVRVSGGLLQGKISSDGSYTAYYGVPYATVEKRFQDAVPNPQWSGVKKADEENIRCTQRIFHSSIVLGQEDCLTLNVYAPTNTSENLRSVMVFIHGGGFSDGSGSSIMYGPENFMKHDIVLVTINYRLDILGHLCLGIKEAPGNVGLKDQVQALKWVQKNIKIFGGDPDRVTIFGESAGAASVSYHILSPMSKGLFSKAIMQSGTALTPWAFQYDPIYIAHQFAQQFGEDTKDLHNLVKMLNEKSDRELIKVRIPRLVGTIVISDFIFVPCLEKQIEGVDRFLPDHPYEIISKGNYNKVPVLIGYNNEEGYYFVGKEDDKTINTLDFFNSIPNNLKFPSEEINYEIGNKLKDLYMQNQNVSKNTLREYSRYIGESQIIYPIIWTIEEFLKTMKKPVYAYKFAYDGSLNLAKMAAGLKKYPGATHGDELFYMFKTKVPARVTSSDKDMTSKVTTMWTDFAKYEDPTHEESLFPVKWKAASTKDPELFVIDEEFTYTDLYDNDRTKFWKTLYTKYFRND